jgi:hypothetical protein
MFAHYALACRRRHNAAASSQRLLDDHVFDRFPPLSVYLPGFELEDLDPHLL